MKEQVGFWKDEEWWRLEESRGDYDCEQGDCPRTGIWEATCPGEEDNAWTVLCHPHMVEFSGLTGLEKPPCRYCAGIGTGFPDAPCICERD